MATRNKKKSVRAAAQLRRLRAATGLASQFDEIARNLGAAEFALLLAQFGRLQCRLAPLLDSDFPKTSRVSRRLANRTIEEANCRLQTSTRPFRWHRNKGPAERGEHLADDDGLLKLDGSGVALPLHATDGRHGVAIFVGDEIRWDDRDLLDAHLHCMRLFEDADRFQAGASRGKFALSKRELDCLRLTADGRTSAEIGELLALSRHTTDQYLNSACRKLNAVNRTQAVSKALRGGLIG